MREDRREKPGDGHTPQDRASNRRKSIFEVLQIKYLHCFRDLGIMNMLEGVIH